MLAYALLVSVVVSFITIAAIGHLLLLMAVWPDLFGTPRSEVAAAEADFAPREPSAPKNSRLAA